MKTTFTKFASVLLLAILITSCKKDPTPLKSYQSMNGNWSCDFDACEVVVDSSLSIFSNVTDLTISNMNTVEDRGNFAWLGCIEGSGEFVIADSDRADYDLLFIPKSEGLTELDEDLNLVPASFEWDALVPEGAEAAVSELNATKIYIKCVSDDHFTMYILYPSGQNITYNWVR